MERTMTLTPDQLALRLRGITATDCAAIAGVHPERSPIDVWREKRGEAPPFEGNKRTKWGNLLEPVVRTDYEDRSGLRIEVPGTLEHPDAPWMLCSPDGVAYQDIDPVRGLEIKCHTVRLAHLYGAPGSDEVPPYVLAQCVWSMAVTGLSRWDVVAFIDGQPTDYIIDRDDEVIDMLRERAERFLVDNVRGGAVPDPDGSEGFDEWLKDRHKTNGADLIELQADADRDLLALIDRAKLLREQGADIERELALIGQTLKLRIADQAGVTWKDSKGKAQKLTWKRNKPSRKVDYVSIANDTRTDARMALSAKRCNIERALICLQVMGEHTPIGENSRAAMTAGQLAELVSVLQTSLEEVAARTDAAYTTEIPGNRPLLYPKSWDGKKSKEQE
jgi:putative phage-type endonuclease